MKSKSFILPNPAKTLQKIFLTIFWMPMPLGEGEILRSQLMPTKRPGRTLQNKKDSKAEAPIPKPLLKNDWSLGQEFLQASGTNHRHNYLLIFLTWHLDQNCTIAAE